MRIQNNIMALNTHRVYNINNSNVSKSSEKLSSGYRINRAGDDAAGLAISEKMRAQIRGLNMASKNSNDAISLVQTAEGTLQEVHSMLQRMNELAVQSASDTNVEIDRGALQLEFENLQDEIDQLARTTKFNDTVLLDGSLAKKTGGVTPGGPGGTGSAGGSTPVALTAAEMVEYFGAGYTGAANPTLTQPNIDLDVVKFTSAKENGFETGAKLDVYLQVRDNPNADVASGANKLEDLVLNVGGKQLKFVSSTDSRIQGGTQLNYDIEDVTGAATPHTVTFADEDGNKVEVQLDGATAQNLGTELKAKLGTTAIKGAIGFKSTDVNVVNTGKSTALTAATSSAVGTSVAAAAELELSFGSDNALAAGEYTVRAVARTADSDTAVVAGTTAATGQIVLQLIDKNGSITELTYDSSSDVTGPTALNAAIATDDLLVFSDGKGNKLTLTGDNTGTAAGILSEMNGKSLVVEKPVSEKAKLEEGMGLTFGKLTNLGINDQALADGEYTIKIGAADGGVFTEYDSDAEAWADPALTLADLQIQITDSSGAVVNVLKLSNTTEITGTNNAALTGATALNAVTAKKNQTLVFESDDGGHVMDIRIGDKDLDAGSIAKMLGQINDTIYTVGDPAADGGTTNPDGSTVIEDEGMYIQVGAEEGHTLGISIDAMNTEGLKLTKAMANISTREDASKAITSSREAINMVSTQRATLGAMQNRLEHKIAALDITSENLTSAESRIRDVDMAKEMTNFTKNQILVQASTAMLAQANAAPQGVLQLLG